MARRVDTAFGTHSVWLTPFAIALLAVASTLQIGNVQLAFIALPLLGMLALERGRRATGGVLLAYATVSKLFPASLIVYLLIRRDWRGAAWTIGACAILALIALADVGWTPFAAFLDHLPKLLSGGSLPGPDPQPGRHRDQISRSLASCSSCASSAARSGASARPRIVGWAYTMVVLWAVWGAWHRAVANWLWNHWCGCRSCILASMRSPFLPGYGVFPSLWLATLAVGVWWTDGSRRLLFLALWAGLAVNIEQGGASPAVNSIPILGETLIAFTLATPGPDSACPTRFRRLLRPTAYSVPV